MMPLSLQYNPSSWEDIDGEPYVHPTFLSETSDKLWIKSMFDSVAQRESHITFIRT